MKTLTIFHFPLNKQAFHLMEIQKPPENYFFLVDKITELLAFTRHLLKQKTEENFQVF
jgi:hypothetical protein